MQFRVVQLVASFYGFLGVALGALGAHALEPRLEASKMANAWRTAVLYELVHAVALLAVAAMMENAPSTRSRGLLRWVAFSWTIGVAFFSGSLFGLALGGPTWLGPVTPLGGLALLAGWAILFLECAKARSKTT